MLKDLIPLASPYRDWTNFEFLDGQGQRHEIDVHVSGRGRLHLLKLKAFTGMITDGNGQTRSVLSMGGRRQTQRSPLLLGRRKTQRLECRLEEKFAKAEAR
jgi:hypothetical protein